MYLSCEVPKGCEKILAGHVGKLYQPFAKKSWRGLLFYRVCVRHTRSDFGVFDHDQTVLVKLDFAISYSPHNLWKDSKISASVALTVVVFE